MEINIEETNRFNNFITNILDTLLENDSYSLNFLINSFYYQYNMDDILQDSFENDESLKKNNNLCLKTKEKKLQKDINLDCCICMEKLFKDQEVYHCNKCNDYFHYSCMNEWIKMNNTCPKCRDNIQIIENKNFEEWIDDNLKI